jgi:hypothetical protein
MEGKVPLQVRPSIPGKFFAYFFSIFFCSISLLV